MSLADIKKIIGQDFDEVEKALEERLFSINKEIQVLRNQQKVIIKMVRSQGNIEKSRIVTKDKWVSMLSAAGLDEEGMRNWHVEFEKNSPEAHQDFLESIGISSEEIVSIRKKSKRNT